MSKKLEQEEYHRNGDHKEGAQQGSGEGKMGEKVEEISVNCGYKIDQDLK